MSDETPAPAAALDELTERLADDLVTLDKELGEVDLLVTQARAEAARHEARRVAAGEKLAALSDDVPDKDRIEALTTIVTLTKRAALMETQVDVLDGKRRALGRYRDAVASYIDAVGALDPNAVAARAAEIQLASAESAVDAPMPPGVSRLVLRAQEDLRRDIARAMHDGPAQSLTNIVLQAQIVDRLVGRDPDAAATEVKHLIAMVQQTLDATKSFIFDVRPMVLDDLGLVPTLRRATRDRGRRADVPVEFESMGQDRRLSMDLESGLFRILDEALAAYLAAGPDKVTLRLDWGERLEAHVTAIRAVAETTPRPAAVAPTIPGKDLPPALAAMMEDRRADERDAEEAAVRDSIVHLPPATWREIQARATSIGVTVDAIAGGGEIRLLADLPEPDAPIGALDTADSVAADAPVG